jgi:hypothetical protein
MERYGGYGGGYGGFMGGARNPFSKKPEKQETESDEFVMETDVEDETFEVKSGENTTEVEQAKMIFTREDDDYKRLRIIKAPSFDLKKPDRQVLRD